MTTAKPGKHAEPPRPASSVEHPRDDATPRTAENRLEASLHREAEHWGPGDDEIAAVTRPPSDS